jgi:integrase
MKTEGADQASGHVQATPIASEKRQRPKETPEGEAKRGEARIYRIEGDGYVRWRVRFYWNATPYPSPFCLLAAHARALKARADSVLFELRSGLRTLPAGIDVAGYVFGGGRIEAPPPAPPPMQAKGPTLAELLDRYEREGQTDDKEDSTFSIEKIHIGLLRRFLKKGGKLNDHLKEVGSDVFVDYRRARLRGRTNKGGLVKAVTVNKDMITIRQVLDFGVAKKMLTENPLHGLAELPEDEPGEFMTLEEYDDRVKRGVMTPEKLTEYRRLVYLQQAEVVDLLAVVGGSVYFVAIAIAALTGARRGELVKLTWEHVDLVRSEITLLSKKQSRKVREKARKVGLHPRLAAILTGYRETTGGRGYLFPGAGRDRLSPDRLHDALVEAVRETKYANVRFHNLRHSFATAYAAHPNATLKGLMEAMGHHTTETTLRYWHVTPKERGAVVQNLFGASPTQPPPAATTDGDHGPA